MELHSNLCFDVDDKVISPLYLSLLKTTFEEHHEAAIKELSAALLEYGQNNLSLRQFVNLLEATLPAQSIGLGFNFGKQLSLVAMDAFGQLVMSCQTLNEALQTIKRFRLFLALPLNIDERSLCDHHQISIKGLYNERHSEKLQAFIAATAISCLQHQARWLSGKDLNYIELKIPSSYAQSPTQKHLLKKYQSIFACEVGFESNTIQMIFPSAYLELPVLSANKAIKSDKLKTCEQALSRWQSKFCLKQRVNSIIRASAPNFPNNEDVAAALHLSKSCLYRKLQEQGTSYQELLSNYKRERAEDLLRNTSMTINEISESLGFSDSSTFRRAFKTWTGLQPSSLRESEKTKYEKTCLSAQAL